LIIQKTALRYLRTVNTKPTHFFSVAEIKETNNDFLALYLTEYLFIVHGLAVTWQHKTVM
jgi:hypothetical protein